MSFDTSAVHKTLDELANKYSSRSRLKIINITVDVQVYDEYLSMYYSSLQVGQDDFTIRIDTPDYSNIKGGYGIFGCYEKVTHAIYFKSEYLNSLGFQ